MVQNNGIYDSFRLAREAGNKKFAVLIDPDKIDEAGLVKLVDRSLEAGVDYFFVGGSLLTQDRLDECLDVVKSQDRIPAILFPGSTLQISDKADAIFFLSLISGRNADLLIGKHVEAAPILRSTNLEIISTGYMLVNGGAETTASYISNTKPLPADKPEIAVSTALAAEMLGMSTLYMDAGSGAKSAIQEKMILKVNQNTDMPIIVGGGIRTPEKALANCAAGADIIVVGNAIEEDQSLIGEIASAIHSTPTIHT